MQATSASGSGFFSRRVPAQKQYTPDHLVALVLKRGNPAEQEEFLEYYHWCVEEIKSAGAALEQVLEQLEGKFDQPFTDWLNEGGFLSEGWHHRTITEWDKWSRGKREERAESQRKSDGITGGYPVEKGKDILSLRWQACVYVGWTLLQLFRGIVGDMALQLQRSGKLSVDSVANVTDINGTDTNSSFTNSSFTNSSATNSSDASGAQDNPAQVLFHLLGLMQLVATCCTVVPFGIHMTAQVRNWMRSTAEMGKSRKIALNGFKDAVAFMTEEEPTSQQAQSFRMAMEGWRERGSAAGRLEVWKSRFSVWRDLFSLFNTTMISITSYHLVSGQTLFKSPIQAGWVQALGGVAGFLQHACNIGQGTVEFLSATRKRDISVALIEKALRVPEDCRVNLNTSLRKPRPVTHEWILEGIANISARRSEEHQAWTERKEQGYSVVRGVQGTLGLVTSGAAIAYGSMQIRFDDKAPLDALDFSLAGTLLSGAYYCFAAWTKMEFLRNSEKNEKKQRYLNAQFVRARFTPEMVSDLHRRGAKFKYAIVELLFHDKEKTSWNTISFKKGNEFLLLDLLTENIGKALSEADWARDDRMKILREALDLPTVKWLNDTCGVPLLDLEALFRACLDKAPALRADMLKQGLAKHLRIVLPLGKDKLEKRMDTSILVLAKLDLLETRVRPTEENDEGASFARIMQDFEPEAARLWKKNRAHFLLGTNLEEFIASVLHVYERSGIKKNQPLREEPELASFAKLVAVATHAKAQREAQLKAVAEARLAQLLRRCLGTGFEPEVFSAFQRDVRAYAETSIFKRGDQVSILKRLAGNKAMQALHSLVAQPDWKLDVDGPKLKGQADSDLVAGILLLVERVDFERLIYTSVPLTARSMSSLPTTTTVPQELRESELEDVLIENGDRQGNVDARVEDDSDNLLLPRKSLAKEDEESGPKPSDESSQSKSKRRRGGKRTRHSRLRPLLNQSQAPSSAKASPRNSGQASTPVTKKPIMTDEDPNVLVEEDTDSRVETSDSE